MTRAERADLQRAGYERVGKLARVKECGQHPILVSGRVALGISEHGGVQRCGYGRCGSRWCPDCWSKISAERARDVDAVLKWASEQGFCAGMVTLTAAHVHTATLEEHGGDLVAALASTSTRSLRESMAGAWRRMHAGRRGMAIKSRRIGYARALELTVDDLRASRTPTGVHIHWHVVIISAGEEEFFECAGRMREGWISACAAEGLRAAESGFDAQVVRSRAAAARYLVKGEHRGLTSAALEVTHSGTKVAGSGRCSPEQVLRSAAGADEGSRILARLRAQWADVEEGCRGARWLTWSRDLRKDAGLGVELADEEIVEQTHIPHGGVVAVVRDQDLRWRGIGPADLDEVVRAVPLAEKLEVLVGFLLGAGIRVRVVSWEVWVAMRTAELARMRGEDCAGGG